MRSRNLQIAVGASLALHLALLFWLSRAEPLAKPAAWVAPAQVVVELELASGSGPSSSVSGSPAAAPAAKAVAPPARKRRVKPPSAPKGGGGPGADAPLAAVARGGVPVPSVDLFGPGTQLGPGGTGHLLRNGDGEEPDPRAVAEMQAEEAGRRVQGFVLDELAAARVRGGIVDPYFRRMTEALRAGTANPPKFTQGNFVSDLIAGWSTGAEQYARTGNPYAPGAVPEGGARKDHTTPFEREALRNPGSAAAQLQLKMDAHARFREFADGRFGQGIIALVELRQAGDGKLAGTVLVQSSGNRIFDEHVLKTAPEALATLPPPPERGAGIHPDGLRSLWSFEGKITFMRKVKVNELTPRDGLTAAGMAALSQLTGGFVPTAAGNVDFATGEVEIVDPTRPQFNCRVQLLRVY
jgi:hypothetical protein